MLIVMTRKSRLIMKIITFIMTVPRQSIMEPGGAASRARLLTVACTLSSAPCPISTVHTSVCPPAAARCSGSRPRASFRWINIAILLMRVLTTPRCPSWAAMCSEEKPWCAHKQKAMCRVFYHDFTSYDGTVSMIASQQDHGNRAVWWTSYYYATNSLGDIHIQQMVRSK